MADEQHTPDSGEHDAAEAPPRRRGLGRLAARFRRGRPDHERTIAAETEPEDELAPRPPLELDSDDEPEIDEPETVDLEEIEPEQPAFLVPALLDRESRRPAPLAPVEPEPEDETVEDERASEESEDRDALEATDAPESEDEPAAALADTPEAEAPSPEPEEPAHETPTTVPLAAIEEITPDAALRLVEDDPAEDDPTEDDDTEADEEPEAEADAEPAALESGDESSYDGSYEETDEVEEPSPILAAVPALEPEPEPEFEPRPAQPRTRPAGISAHLGVLTVLATGVIMAFLLIEPSPRWLLLLGAAAVVFGLDGTLRQTWRAPFSMGQETAPFLFVPALYMMGVPVLLEHNISGEFVLVMGLGAGLGFGALAWAEVASVRALAPEYDTARVIVTANTYLTGFAIFALSYVFEISLPAAIVATSIAAAMLAVEVLREGEIDPMETLGLALVTGVIVGEARLLLYYIPLDTYLAGLTLLLVFYLATGLLHSHVVRALNRVVAMEYSGIAAAGLALVVIARTAGLA